MGTSPALQTRRNRDNGVSHVTSHAVQLVRNRCSQHLEAVAALFKPGAKITLIVRRPGFPDQDYLLGDDTIEGAIELLERCKARQPDSQIPTPEEPR